MIGISLDASGDNHDVSIDTTEAANECLGAGAGPQRPQAVSLSALSSPSHCRHVNTPSLSVETKHRNHKHQHWILLSKECCHKTNMKVKKLQWRLFPLL